MEFERIANLIVDCRVASEVKHFVDAWHDESDYIEARTSGSTGEPKIVKLLKSDMKQSARRTIDFFHLSEKSSLLCPLSINYIAGKMMVVRAFLTGATLKIISPTNEPLADSSGQERYDLIAVVPSQLPSLLNQKQKYDRLLVGGAAVNDEMERKLKAEKIEAYLSYGMTETCSHVALRRLGFQKHYSGIGDIVFSKDHRGCLVIESSSMSFRRLVTNDVVSLIDDRNFQWFGRYDNVINSGGIKVYPEVIENKIESLLPSTSFYIKKTASERWGESPALYIEGEPFDTEQLRRKLIDVLLPAERPAQIIFVPQFRRTSTGKLCRR